MLLPQILPIPWDKSNTFWESPAYSIFRNIDDGPESRRNRLVLRAFQFTELRELYLNTLLECADSILQAPVGAPASGVGWLESEVTRVADQIREANYADPSREAYTNADWDESIAPVTKLRLEPPSDDPSASESSLPIYDRTLRARIRCAERRR
ncbi:MAG: hypothetical protein DMF96_01780 [Acidobacteria bacterium]|nr:MAG: hypothetical protein DMF96_01780 [Acidobacteriota bacterium]